MNPELQESIRQHYFASLHGVEGYELNEWSIESSPSRDFAALTAGYWKRRRGGLGSKGLASKVALYDLRNGRCGLLGVREFRAKSAWHDGYVDDSGLLIVFGSDESGSFWNVFALDGANGHGRLFGRLQLPEFSKEGIQLPMEYYDARLSWITRERKVVGHVEGIRIKAVPFFGEYPESDFDSVPPLTSRKERDEYVRHLQDLGAAAAKVDRNAVEALVAEYLIRYVDEATPHLSAPWALRSRRHLNLPGVSAWIRTLKIRKEFEGGGNHHLPESPPQ